MKQIVQILVKDVRRHWPEITASIALLAAFGWNEVRSWTSPDELLAAAGGWFGYRLLTGIVDVALPVAWVFLILRVVQGESLVGDRQFWITRPYEWRNLLAEKVLFLLTTVNVPVFILQIALLWRAGFHATHYIVGLFWMQLMVCLFVLMPGITLATVTATVVQALLGVLLVALFIAGMLMLASYVPSSDFSGPADNIPGLAVIAVCLSVILLQYARRKTAIARWFIVGLGGVLILALTATPYRMIVAHEFPTLPNGQNAPFSLALLPRQAADSDPVQEKEVQIRIPLSVSRLAPDSIVSTDGAFVEIRSPDFDWNSGWFSRGRVFYPEQSQIEIDFTLKNRVFERLQSTAVALRLSLAYTLYRDTNRREFVIPAGRFELEGATVCSVKQPFYLQELHCVAPLRPPESVLITNDMSANTCPLGRDEIRPTPGVIARAWERNGSDSVEPGIDPVQLFDIYPVISNSPYPAARYSAGLCPGTPVVLSNPVRVLQSQIALSAEGVHLIDYREKPLELGNITFGLR